jgi:hypothetical protein
MERQTRSKTQKESLDGTVLTDFSISLSLSKDNFSSFYLPDKKEKKAKLEQSS